MPQEWDPNRHFTACAFCQRPIPRETAFVMGGRPYCDLGHYLKWTQHLDVEKRKRNIKPQVV